MLQQKTLKVTALLCALALSALGANRALADDDSNPGSYTGTYLDSLPERAEIMHLHADGTAGMTLSDQVTSGAGGFTFSDSMGSWKIVGPRRLAARFLNLNFNLTGAAPAYSGMAVVDYDLQFAPGRRTFTASCQGKIYPAGQDPFAPGATGNVGTEDVLYLLHRMGFETGIDTPAEAAILVIAVVYVIAAAFNLTESRICQIHAQALQSIKGCLQRCDPCFMQPYSF